MSDWINGARSDLQSLDIRASLHSPKYLSPMHSPVASTSQVKIEDTFLPDDDDQAWQYPEPEIEPEYEEPLEDIPLSDPSVLPEPTIDLPDLHHSMSPTSVPFEQYMAQQSSTASQHEVTPEELAEQEAEVQTYEDLDTAYTETPIRFVPPKLTSPSPTSDPQDPVLPRPYYQPKSNDLVSLHDLRLRATSQTGKAAPFLVSRREPDLTRESAHPLTPAQNASLLGYSQHQTKLIDMERAQVQETAEKRLKAKTPKPGDRYVLFDLTTQWADEAAQKVWREKIGKSRAKDEVEGAKVLVCSMQERQEHDLRSV